MTDTSTPAGFLLNVPNLVPGCHALTPSQHPRTTIPSPRKPGAQGIAHPTAALETFLPPLAPSPSTKLVPLGGIPCAPTWVRLCPYSSEDSVSKSGVWKTKKKGVGGWGALHTGDLTLRNTPPGGDV